MTVLSNESMKNIQKAIEDHINGLGFALFVFEKNKKYADANYISNTEEYEISEVLKSVANQLDSSYTIGNA